MSAETASLDDRTGTPLIHCYSASMYSFSLASAWVWDFVLHDA